MMSGLRMPKVAVKSARVNGWPISAARRVHARKCCSAVSTSVPSTSQMIASFAMGVLYRLTGSREPRGGPIGAGVDRAGGQAPGVHASAGGRGRPSMPKRYEYITVDVFTDQAFSGNPVAVVTDARGLSAQDMQRVAAEFNYSEATFVLPPADAPHTARRRVIPPRQ